MSRLVGYHSALAEQGSMQEAYACTRVAKSEIGQIIACIPNRFGVQILSRQQVRILAPAFRGKDKIADFPIGWPSEVVLKDKSGFKLPPRYNIGVCGTYQDKNDIVVDLDHLSTSL